MNRSLAFANPSMSLRLWVGGLLLLLGGIWLGLLAIELVLTLVAPGAHGSVANFWSEKTRYSGIASLIAIAIGLLIFCFSRKRDSRSHFHHHRQRRHSHRASVAHEPKSAAQTSSVSAADVDDESVSFDMGDAARGGQLPPDTPGAPSQRAKVRVKVRIKKRIRKHGK